MGWADCGEDEWGRPIGYAFPATCDHDGCSAAIDRGLGHLCGSMHNNDRADGCGLYFCGEHEHHPCPHEMPEPEADAFWERWSERMADPANVEMERVRGEIVALAEDPAAALAVLRDARAGVAGTMVADLDRLQAYLDAEMEVVTDG